MFRLDLLFARLRINMNDPRSFGAVGMLKLDHFGLTTLARLTPFGSLRYLDVSNNNLTSLQQDVLYAMPWLAHLGPFSPPFPNSQKSNHFNHANYFYI